jgi:predicted component of type VI protein secretion system
MPAETRITIEQETALLERQLDADPPPPAHRAALAGIRLAEIYRTHQHAPAQADALIARLTARYPDAPELAQSQRTSAIIPGALITIEQETAALERLVAADPPPSVHQVALAGIRLAEIYRTHEHAPEKAEALLARLAARFPDARELGTMRHARPG